MSGTTPVTTPLEPSLYSLLSPSLQTSTISHLSLLAIHAESYHLIDRVYTTSNPVLPGQLRNLRFRSRRVMSVKGKEKAVDGEDEGEGEGEWTHSLAYVSSALRSAEYSEASVRAVMGLEVQAASEPDEIDRFVKTLGFRYSYSYSLTGYLFHLPLPMTTVPPLTLHFTITRLSPSSNKGPETHAPNEPYLVQLRPSRPVYAIAQSGDISLQDIVGIMRATAGRIDGLKWSTGSSS